jgi:hypothetical protein
VRGLNGKTFFGFPGDGRRLRDQGYVTRVKTDAPLLSRAFGAVYSPDSGKALPPVASVNMPEKVPA